jgi:hypothetical protein
MVFFEVMTTRSKSDYVFGAERFVRMTGSTNEATHVGVAGAYTLNLKET